MEKLISELDTAQNEFLWKVIWKHAHKYKLTGELGFDELVSVGVERALAVWEEGNYDPDKGKFATFVYEPIVWAMARAQYTGGRSFDLPPLSEHYHRAARAIDEWWPPFMQDREKDPTLSDAINDLAPKGFTMAQIKLAWEWLKTKIVPLEDYDTDDDTDDTPDYLDENKTEIDGKTGAIVDRGYDDETDDEFDASVIEDESTDDEQDSVAADEGDNVSEPWEYRDLGQWIRDKINANCHKSVSEIYVMRAVRGYKPKQVQEGLGISKDQYYTRRKHLHVYLLKLLEEYPNYLAIESAISSI